MGGVTPLVLPPHQLGWGDLDVSWNGGHTHSAHPASGQCQHPKGAGTRRVPWGQGWASCCF